MSGLQFQTVDVKFTKGLDTKTQPKLLQAGQWESLINMSLSDEFAPKTRGGHGALVTAANGNGLATHGNELLTVKGPSVSSISPASVQAIPVTGAAGFVGIDKQELRRNVGMQDTPDCASSDISGLGYVCYVWREKSPANVAVSINCMLVDERSGTQVIPNTALRTNAAAFGARVVFADSAFFVFYIQGTSLYCRVILSSGTIGAEVALITSANLAALNFDACAFGLGSGGGGVMVIYGWNDGTTSGRTIEVIRTGTVPSINSGPTNLFTQANIPIASVTAFCCVAFGDGLHAAGIVTSTGANPLPGLSSAVIDTAWAVTGAQQSQDLQVGATTSPCHLCAVAAGDNGTLYFIRVFRDYTSEWSTNAATTIRACTIDQSNTLQAGGTTIMNSNTFGAGVGARGPQGPFIHGKPFSDGGRIFLPVYVAGVYANLGLAASNPRTQNTQNTFFVLDCGPTGFAIVPGVVVAKGLYGTYGVASVNGTAPTIGTPCSSPMVNTDKFATVSGELTQLVLTSTAINVSPTGLVRLTMSPNVTKCPISTQLGESTYLAGGSLSDYAGAGIVEQGFPLYPEGVQITVNGAGTGAMTAGVHQVVFIYEWIDNAGQRNQSAPSPAITVTTAATGSLTCSIPTLQLSQKTNIQVVPFMTQAAGLTFTRVLLDNGAYVPLLNTTAANAVTFTIDDSDATIAGNEPLYNQPNQAGTTLANIAPGPCTAVWTAQNRLFFDKSDKPGWYGYSQPYVNNVGLQFSPDLESALPVESGGFVMGAAMDEKVIIFGKRRIYVQYGTGPQTNGAFNNYSEPQDIQADVGCSDALSVLPAAPSGIIFKSSKGWYMLQRDLSVKYIGEGVAVHDSRTVLSAVMAENQQEARFCVGSVTLVYSYIVDAWSVFQYSGDYIPAAATWWATDNFGLGRYITISATNGLNHDTGLPYDSVAGTPLAFNISGASPWLHLGAMEGFQRIRRMYMTMTSSGPLPNGSLQLVFFFDDTNTVAYSFSTLTGTLYDDGQIDFRHKLEKQKCKSMRFLFTEAPSFATSDRISGIQAMALEVGMKRGVRKTPAEQNVG